MKSKALPDIKLAKCHGFDNIILESDSQVLVGRLSKTLVYYSVFDSVLEDILFFSCHFNSLAWSHVKRGGNIVAHHLIKLVPFDIEYCPSKISPYVLSDIFPLVNG